MPRSLLFASLAVTLASGCYLSHPRLASGVDAGRPDTASLDVPVPPLRDVDLPRRDIGTPTGTYWTLERRDAFLRIDHELGCTQYEGGRIALTVAAPLGTVCEHSGPVDLVRDPSVTTVTAYVWVEHHDDPGACLGVTALSQRTFLLPASEGTFTAMTDDGGSRVEYRASAIDDLPCTRAGARDAECVNDCQCQDGLVCIPQLGDIVECFGGHCGDPCNAEGGAIPPVYGAHLECDTWEQCRPGLAGGSSSCQPIEGDACIAGCVAGLTCEGTDEPSECDWEVRLSAEVRHPCADDAGCDPGLHCVEGRDRRRSCEVPCMTNEMRCPFMHECQSDRWVCEWIGE